MRHVVQSAAVLFLGLAIVSCGEQSRRELVATGRPIVGGTSDTNPAHMATVAITNQPGSYFCSGTLITESVVLTAAHCLEDYWGNPVDPSTLQVFFGDNAYGAGEYRQVSEGIQHPQWNRQALSRDIALLRLASVAPAGIAPIPYLPASQGLTQADVGTTVDFSGFGLTENNTDGQKLHVQNTIDVVCDDAAGCWNNQVVQYAMGYDETPGGPCSGDSGGPAYIMRGGTEYVAGITSYGDQNCESFGVSTMADRYASFIDDFINSGGAEICDNNIDDDGDQLIDCDDPGCNLDPNCMGPSACASAATISCGQTVSGDTSGGVGNFVNYHCPEGGVTENGPEVAYLLDAPAGTQITVDLTLGNGGDLDLFALSGQNGDCSPDDCLAVSGESQTNPEHLTITKGSGEEYLVIETWDNANSYTLTVTCGQPEDCSNNVDDDGDNLVDCDDPDCAGDPNCAASSACTVAQPIGCGDSVSGDTSNGVQLFASYSCLSNATEDGPEVAYLLNIPTGTRVVADMSNAAGSDLDLFLLPAVGGTCDPSGCLDYSGNYQQPEQISFSMPTGGAYLVVETWENPASFTLSLTCSGAPENCTNNIDDDGDKLVDCEDPDCADHPDCQQTQEICDNGTDDDGDNLVDCDDADCYGDPACLPQDEDCVNGVDDDGDTLVDCDDPDCDNDIHCVTPAEDCANGSDDDGDTLVDCDDPDCSGAANCQQTQENCSNGSDDDADGFTDCNDSDCQQDPACSGGNDGGGCGCGSSGERGNTGGLGLLLGLWLTIRRR